MAERGTVRNVAAALAAKANNGGAKWAAVVMVAMGAAGANSYRLGIEHRMTELEGLKPAVAAAQKWQADWEKTGELPVDRAQNAALATIAERLEALEDHAAFGTRFTGEDALVTAPCIVGTARAVRRVMLDHRSGIEEKDYQDFVEDLEQCIRVVKDQLVQLRRRRGG